MFTFCPLQGALSESTASQSLLELDGGVKVLIDVGWDETFDLDKLKELEKYVTTPLDECIRRAPMLVSAEPTRIQTSPNTVADPPHARDRLPPCRLRPLLQELPALHPHPRLCHPASHRPRANTAAGPIRLDAGSCDDYQPWLPGRDFVCVHPASIS